MKLHRWLVYVGIALAAGAAFAGPHGCGLPNITKASELHQFLSLRAVETVRRAANTKDDLADLVAPSATFSLGAGDVGRPLGTGVGGARELARAMKADTYRFLGWDYMDMPADACAQQKVKVEFINRQEQNVSSVEFTFEAGLLVSAVGWERSFEIGPL